MSGERMRDLVATMQERVLGRTQLNVKLLGVGGISPQEVVAKALAYGLNFFDVHGYVDSQGLFTCNPEAALNYVFSQKISVAIPGMMSLDELENNIRIAAGFSGIAESDLSALKKEADEISKTEGKHLCRQCGYCVPVCPQGIHIKDLFYQERQANRYYSKDWAQAAYAKVAHQADECIECGACEGECPYDLPIREMLKHVHVDLST